MQVTDTDGHTGAMPNMTGGTNIWLRIDNHSET